MLSNLPLKIGKSGQNSEVVSSAYLGKYRKREIWGMDPSLLEWLSGHTGHLLSLPVI